jgi:hypothetical protein
MWHCEVLFQNAILIHVLFQNASSCQVLFQNATLLQHVAKHTIYGKCTKTKVPFI